MKTKAKSVHIYTLYLWSKKHYKGTDYRCAKNKMNLYDGMIKGVKNNKTKFVHSAGELLQTIEKWYKKDERRKTLC